MGCLLIIIAGLLLKAPIAYLYGAKYGALVFPCALLLCGIFCFIVEILSIMIDKNMVEKEKNDGRETDFLD